MIRPGFCARVPAARIGLVRALAGAYTMAYLAPRRQMLRRVVRTAPELFAPVGPVRVLARPLPSAAADALNDAALVSTALFALGAGRAFDAVSLDAARGRHGMPAAHPRYGWPLHLMNATTAAA